MSTEGKTGLDLLHDELGRAVALETQLHALVSRQLEHEDVKRHGRAVDWLQRLEPRVHAHRVSLGKTLERLAARPSPLRQALGPALDSLAEWTKRAGEAPGPELTRDLREAYALLSSTIASYLVVAITADVLDDPQTVALAQAHSDDANAFLDELASLIVSLTREELLGTADTRVRRAAGE